MAGGGTGKGKAEVPRRAPGAGLGVSSGKTAGSMTIGLWRPQPFTTNDTWIMDDHMYGSDVTGLCWS